MIAKLVSLALMIAAWLFVLSLFFGETDAAKTLRRGAAFSFVFVFLVPLFASLALSFGTITHRGHSPVSTIEFALAAIGVLVLVVVVSFAAYGYLNLRSQTRSRHAPSHSPGVRFAKQRPTAHDDPHDEEEHR